MGKIINEVLSFKFYDLKTGEEIPPYVAPPKDEQKEQELEKLRKQTGYYFPELCPSCGQYYEGYDGHYELNGDVKCKHCINKYQKAKASTTEYKQYRQTYMEEYMKKMEKKVS